jgi:glycosyltransferase involved in cell wall biosynthesis
MTREIDVTVVMATYGRREACRRAIESVLSQVPSPRELIVSDDGSSDGTAEMLQEWAANEPRLKVFTGDHLGTPAPHRNRGIALAQGNWIGFLDDDDAWLPGKLAAQEPYLNADFDVVSTNALRSTTGTPYFPEALELATPSRGTILRTNPVIISSAMIRRDLVQRIGGLAEERWMGGVADYALWLAASDHGARFAILGEPLILYDDAHIGRMSATPLRMQVAVARLFWRRWRAMPDDRLVRRAAFAMASYTITVAKDVLRERLRR